MRKETYFPNCADVNPLREERFRTPCTLPDMAADEHLRPGRPRLLRAINERAVLERLRTAGPASRSELAAATGVSKPTVGQALANLERAGLVRTAGQRVGERGRSALLYELDPTAAYVAGVDVGRSWV